MHIPTALLSLCLAALVVARGETDRTVSPALFTELEEAARLADIAYCVGVSGIWKPFGCLSRCGDFPDFELVDTWNKGPLLSDSCGYIALDHPKKRIVVAFRGTYSIASALADLATTPQVYVPYPEDPPPPTSKPKRRGWWGWIPWFGGRGTQQDVLSALAGSGDGDGSKQYIGGEGGTDKPTCKNCTVHLGFLTAWTHTRPSLLPHLARLATVVPDYEIHLLGHSLGGAIAALAGLELRARGVECVVTTFGEPRVGNEGLVGYLDEVFGVGGEGEEVGGNMGEGREGAGFRRVTHVGDPVPLLPLGEWGYAMHGGEIYVSKPSLPFEVTDMEMCVGDNDEKCIAGADGGILDWKAVAAVAAAAAEDTADGQGEDEVVREKWGLASRFRIWQLLFAHRDYFWRIGLCVPGGDPRGWGRGWYEKEREKEKERGGDEL